MKIADLYVRVSTEEQKVTGYSQRYQEEVLKKYCEINSIAIRRVIFEDYSAKTFNRPQWKQLIAEYKRKKPSNLSLLLVTKWDRFSRNTGDAYHMINYLSKIGIEVRAIEQPLDTSIPENSMMMAFFLSIPEVENMRRSLNVREGMQRAKKEGRWMGTAPVGYKNKISDSGKKYIETIEPQARIMQQAFEKLATGIYSIKQIYLEAVGSGLQRSYNCFWKAIRNPAYCGLITLRRKDADSPILYIVGEHKALISENLFWKAQQILTRKKKSIRCSNLNKKFPLRGFLTCPKCGKNLTGSGSKGKTKVYYYYHCISRCGFRSQISRIHSQLTQFLSNLVLWGQYKHVFYQVFAHSIQDIIDQNTLNQRKLLQKIQRLTFRADKAKSLLLDGTLESKEYKVIQSDCEIQINILGEALQNSIRESKEISKAISYSRDQVSNLKELFEICDLNDKRELLYFLFPYGVICNENCFCIHKITESLQFIYIDLPNEILNQPHLPEVDEKLVNEPALFRRIILDLVNERRIASIKQGKEIITFFRKIANIIIKQFLENGQILPAT